MLSPQGVVELCRHDIFQFIFFMKSVSLNRFEQVCSNNSGDIQLAAKEKNRRKTRDDGKELSLSPMRLRYLSV